MQVSTSFKANALWRMLFAVSRKDKGSSDAVNFPKKESISAANVLFREPVFPERNRTNLGSQPASFRKCFRRLRKVKAGKGNIASSGTGIIRRRHPAVWMSNASHFSFYGVALEVNGMVIISEH